MIKLNLAIYEGDIDVIEFNNIQDLCEYIKELHTFDCVWLATDDGEKGEIIVTENVETIVSSIILFWSNSDNIFVQEYQTYEDAYFVALDMREGNPKSINF
jgi:uncharacterized protein YutD